jgi:hypothetical protein
MAMDWRHIGERQQIKRIWTISTVKTDLNQIVHTTIALRCVPITMEVGDNFGPIPIAGSREKVEFYERFFQTQKIW